MKTNVLLKHFYIFQMVLIFVLCTSFMIACMSWFWHTWNNHMQVRFNIYFTNASSNFLIIIQKMYIRFPPSTRGIKQSSYSKLSWNLFILAYLYQFSKLCLYFLIYFSIISILNILSKNSAWSFILKSKVTLCEVIFK